MVSGYCTPFQHISVSLSSSNLVQGQIVCLNQEDGSTITYFRILAMLHTSSLRWSVLVTQQPLLLLQGPSALVWKNILV